MRRGKEGGKRAGERRRGQKIEGLNVSRGQMKKKNRRTEDGGKGQKTERTGEKDVRHGEMRQQQ